MSLSRTPPFLRHTLNLIGSQNQQEVASLEPSDPTRMQIIDSLSQLYADSKYCPVNPTLHAWEVSRIGETPIGSGGFGDYWMGSFLGCHRLEGRTRNEGMEATTTPKYLAFHRVYPGIAVEGILYDISMDGEWRYEAVLEIPS